MIYKLFGKHFQSISDDNQSLDAYEPTVHSTTPTLLYDDDDDDGADNDNEATNILSSARVTFNMEPHQVPTENNNQSIATITASDEEHHTHEMATMMNIDTISDSTSNSSSNTNNIDQLIRICHSIITRNSINGLTDDELYLLCEHMPTVRTNKTIEIEVFAAQKTKYAKLRAYHQRRIKQLNNEIMKSEQLMKMLRSKH